MKITQIRNTTQQLEYGGVRFLIGPMLCEKGSFPGFPGTVNEDLSNPMTSLPMSLDQIAAVDAVIVTHMHEDHWDAAVIGFEPMAHQ